MKKTLTLAIDPSRMKSSFYLMLWEYFTADGSVIINLRTFERIILQEWEIFSNDGYVDWTCRFSKALKTWMMQSSPILIVTGMHYPWSTSLKHLAPGRCPGFPNTSGSFKRLRSKKGCESLLSVTWNQFTLLYPIRSFYPYTEKLPGSKVCKSLD